MAAQCGMTAWATWTSEVSAESPAVRLLAGAVCARVSRGETVQESRGGGITARNAPACKRLNLTVARGALEVDCSAHDKVNKWSTAIQSLPT